MELDVEMQGVKHRIHLSDAPTGEEVLAACNLKPDMVILVVNERAVPYTVPIQADDQVKVVRVASGG